MHGEVSQQVLMKYKNSDVFICLGIYASVSFEGAIGANFTKLYGIDEDPVLVEHAKIIIPDYLRYHKRRNISYDIQVGTLYALKRLIAQMRTSFTIVLGDNFPSIDEARVNTILRELEVIKEHPIKTHTILIDYINYAGTKRFGNITVEAIQQKLLEINPHYVFAFEKGGHLGQEEQAILIARVLR